MESKRDVRIKIFKAVILTMIISVILTATFLISFSDRLGLVNFLYFKNQSLSSNTLNDISNSSSASTDATLQLGATLSSLKSFINENYDGTYNEDEMVETAIKGYVEGLGDKYSEYITKEEYKEFYTNYISGDYCGVGIYVGIDTEADKVLVIAPMPGGSAAEAGIESGDYIIGIDDVDGFTSKDLDLVTDMIKDGEEGTTLDMKIQKQDGTIKTYTLTRKKINLTETYAKYLDNNIGYLKIESFDDGEYKKVLSEYEKIKDNLRGLIIDLRSNGGGILKEAEEIADLFLSKDKVIYIESSKNGNEETHKAIKDKTINVPIVILVNNSTASASEVLTAALRENLDCKIVGEKTYGKGVIQTVYNLKDGSALKLTTNHYYTPKHEVINEVGIKPDIEVSVSGDNSGYSISNKEDNQLQQAIKTLEEQITKLYN